MSLNKRMFTPSKKGSHIGGDYTVESTDSKYVVSQDTMDLVAQLSGISNFAQMSSFAGLNSLSTEQVSKLINVLEKDITTNNALVNQNNETIASLQREIDTPITGIQALYESSMNAYSTNLRDFNSTLRGFSVNEEIISSLSSSIEHLSTTYYYESSTLSSYNDKYSTLFHEMENIASVLSSQISQRDHLSSIVGTTQTEYDPIVLQEYLQSTISSVSVLSYYSTIQADSNYTEEYFSTAIHIAQSTIDGYSAEKSTIQAAYDSYFQTSNTLATNSQNVFAQISQDIESFYTKALTSVQNNLLSYQYQIQEWSAFVGYLVSNLIMSKSYVVLQKNSVSPNSFYTIAQGQTTTSSEQPTSSSGKPTSSSGQQTGGQVTNTLPEMNNVQYTILITGIQSILDALNTLDVSFNNILSVCSSEMTERQNYISIRKNLTMIEGNVMTGVNNIGDVTVIYNTYKTRLDTSEVNINNYKNSRLRKAEAIMNVLNIQIAVINNYLDNQQIIIPDTDLYTTTQVSKELVLPDPISTDNTPFAVDPTVYQIFDPLFSKKTDLPAVYANMPGDTALYTYNLTNVYNALPTTGSFSVNINNVETMSIVNINSVDTKNTNNDGTFSKITQGSLLHIAYTSVNVKYDSLFTINTILNNGGFWTFTVSYISGSINFSLVPISCIIYFSILPSGTTVSAATTSAATTSAATTSAATTSRATTSAATTSAATTSRATTSRATTSAATTSAATTSRATTSAVAAPASPFSLFGTSGSPAPTNTVGNLFGTPVAATASIPTTSGPTTSIPTTSGPTASVNPPDTVTNGVSPFSLFGGTGSRAPTNMVGNLFGGPGAAATDTVISFLGGTGSSAPTYTVGNLFGP